MNSSKMVIAISATAIAMAGAYQMGSPHEGMVASKPVAQALTSDVSIHRAEDVAPLTGFDQLKIGGYVTQDSVDPQGVDWSEVKFTGKNGVNAISDVTVEMARKIDRENLEAVAEAAEIDWIVYSGSSDAKGGYELSDHVRTVVNAGPENARSVLKSLSSGDISHEEAILLSKKLEASRTGVSRQDVQSLVAENSIATERFVMKNILGDDMPDEKEIAFAGLSGKAAHEAEIPREASASDMTADIMSSVFRSRTRSEQVIDRVEDEGPSMDM